MALTEDEKKNPFLKKDPKFRKFYNQHLSIIKKKNSDVDLIMACGDMREMADTIGKKTKL